MDRANALFIKMSPDKFLNLLLPPTYLYKVFTRVIKCHNHQTKHSVKYPYSNISAFTVKAVRTWTTESNAQHAIKAMSLQHKSCNTMGNTARNELYGDRLWYFHHNKTTCFIHTICYISGCDVCTYHYIYLAEFYRVYVLIFYWMRYNGYYTPKGFKSLSPRSSYYSTQVDVIKTLYFTNYEFSTDLGNELIDGIVRLTSSNFVGGTRIIKYTGCKHAHAIIKC